MFNLKYYKYLGHMMSHEGIAKVPKVDAVIKMVRPYNVSSLKSFLGSVQFYGKFLLDLSTVTELLYQLYTIAMGCRRRGSISTIEYHALSRYSTCPL